MLQEKFDELFMDRTSNPKEGMTEAEILRYESARNTFDNLWQSINEMLPASGKDLMFELDSIIGELHILITQSAYRVGLEDGIKLEGGLKLFGLDYVIKPFPMKSPGVSSFRKKQLSKHYQGVQP
jgi:hypothetical protein